MNNQNFYTFKGYEAINSNILTPSMEDYLEMICRILETEKVVRINRLSEELNVKPSSASKMVNNLKEAGLLYYEKYGYVCLSDEGKSVGDYLIFRHSVLNRLLCYINGTENELEQVEKIEHFINKDTVMNIQKFLDKICPDF
jgi:Mn-dependent DtxR family transcriptional regulator